MQMKYKHKKQFFNPTFLMENRTEECICGRKTGDTSKTSLITFANFLHVLVQSSTFYGSFWQRESTAKNIEIVKFS